MASEALTDVIRRAESLPPDEQLQVAGRLVDNARRGLQDGDTTGETGDRAKRHPLAGRPCVDKEPLRRAFDELFEQMGIEDKEPIGIEALHERMLKSGIRPEDNLLSRGIIEMREE